MALRVVASRPDPALLTLPWSTPLAEWTHEYVVPLPRGLSRHVVRIVRAKQQTLAVKETEAEIALREYRLLRDLQRMGLPAVVPKGVITGRTDGAGEPLPATLITEHLPYSLPYRSLFQRGLGPDELPAIFDALVVLLVRLHLADFFWGDVSLSNVLFRRSADGFAAYLVDAETGELQATLGRRMREHDLTVARENVFAELMDLQAASELDTGVDPFEILDLIADRYDVLWAELTAAEEFGADQMWRIEQRIERLNDLGFDVDELEIVTDLDGDRVRIQPKVVDLGHHCRELQGLTGLNVEDAQARRLLNDLAAFTAHYDLGGEDRQLVASRWITTIYEPLSRLIPAGERSRLSPPQFFHEVLEHRWYLSERAGHEVDIFDAAQAYVADVLGAEAADESAAAP